MLIRNGIVLVAEIEQQKQLRPQHEAILYAATSRLRPILLTAFTTVLGLGFATLLTLLVLPVI